MNSARVLSCSTVARASSAATESANARIPAARDLPGLRISAKCRRIYNHEGGSGEWATKQATEWARRLGRTFGDKLVRQPSMLAEAVSIYSENLPQTLREALIPYVDEDSGHDDDDEDSPAI